MGSAQYHLSQLEKMGRICSVRRGLYKFYFPAGVFHSKEKSVLEVLSHETTRDLLMFIIEQRDPTHTDIIKYLEISSSSVNWHTTRLIELQIIYEIKDGRYKRYRISGEYRYFIVSFLKNYYGNIWESWSSKLAEMFLSLGEDGDNNSKP
jgi:predicted transcriptional regulator